MLFNSQLFIVGFLPATLCLYFALARRAEARKAFLIFASLVFYGWWDIRFVPLLIGLTAANWGIAIWFGARKAKWIPLAGVVMNLLVLGLFKYADFLRGTYFAITGAPWQPWHVVLPLGISFFTFQKISYMIDLRRGKAGVYPLLDFTLFVFFFPQLIAGPIVRHNEIIHQFRTDPRGPAMWENLGRGFLLFIIGVTKKTGIADSLSPFADAGFAQLQTGAPGLVESWTAVLAYTLQIYFDFSGYSDMAIGLGLMFGLRLPFNFDAPYRATSIQDFWRRWHMTLSRFLRDYLYIPLGGSRAGAARQVVNVVVTMLLGGLWHGANWTFVAWGGLHGLALAVHQVWARAGLRLPAPAAWAITMLFVMTSWVLFRAASFADAATMFRGMAGFGARGARPAAEVVYVLVAGVAAALVGPVSQSFALKRARPDPWLAVSSGLVLVWLLLLIGGRLPNVFIYFQF